MISLGQGKGLETGYQNQAISGLEQEGQICEVPAVHPHPRNLFVLFKSRLIRKLVLIDFHC